MTPLTPPTCDCCHRPDSDEASLLESTRWVGLRICEPCLEEFFDGLVSLTQYDTEGCEDIAERVRIQGLDYRAPSDSIIADNPITASLLDYEVVSFATGFYYNQLSPSGDRYTRLIKRNQQQFPSGDMRRIQPPRCDCCGNTHDRAALFEYNDIPDLTFCAECQVVLAKYLDGLQLLTLHPLALLLCGESVWVNTGGSTFSELRIGN